MKPDAQTQRDLAALAIVQEWMLIPGSIPPAMAQRVKELVTPPAVVDLPPFLRKWGW